MNDELRDMVVQAASTTDEEVARLPLSGAETALMEEIMSTPVLVEPAAEPPGSRRGRRHVPAAVLALLAGGFWLAGDNGGVPVDGNGGAPADAADVVRVAEANTRVLVDAPDWQVTRVGEFTVTWGEMTFSDGESSLDVHWVPRERYEERVADRGGDSEAVRVEVLGEQGLMFRDDSRARKLATILPPDGPSFLELRGRFDGDEQAYRKILARLTTVDVQTWLDALPDSVVRPGSQSAVVDEILRDIPVPPGFDRDDITLSRGVTARYHVGAEVVGAVACRWIELWREGLRAGDDEVVADAVAAMGSSRSWPILREMNKEGDYSEVVWDTADQMADGELIMDDKIGRSASCSELGFA